MLPDIEATSTRVWWNDAEVHFIAWTDKALIFRWCDDTRNGRGIIQLPRGATRRLLERGVLHIDGDAPAWLYGTPTATVTTPVPKHPAPRPAYVPPPVESRVENSPPKTDLRGIVMRIIRKLTGDGDLRPARAAASAGLDADHPAAQRAPHGSR